MTAASPRASNVRLPLGVRMARTLAARSWRDLKPEVVAKAKLCILDVLASAFASRDLPWSRQAAAVARRNSAGLIGSGAVLIGTADVVSTQDAAFANGVLGHGLVRDDMHVGSVSHLGTVIVPALLALAESTRASGKDFLTALVAGYEVGGKIGRMILDVDVAKNFRPTGITGPVAAAAAASKLLGLNADQTVSALALGANAAAGYNEWAATGGSEMFFHTGLAARSGVTAALLAAEGAYASRTAIDGEAGLLAAFHRDLAPPIPELFADGPEILAVFFKPVPACNFAQSPAQAALAIARRKKVRPNEVERVTVRVTRAAKQYPGCDVSGPFEHVLQAKMSIHYNVAAALRHGNFDEQNYVPQRNHDVLTIATRTRLEEDDELTKAFPAQQGAEVILQTRAGEEIRERVPDVVPPDEGAVRARFAQAAATALGEPGAERLRALVDGLESMSDSSSLSRATRVESAQPAAASAARPAPGKPYTLSRRAAIRPPPTPRASVARSPSGGKSAVAAKRSAATARTAAKKRATRPSRSGKPRTPAARKRRKS
jgi:2-methylcitrate dehydratase PrpD